LLILFLDFRTNHGQEIKVPDLSKMKLEIAEEKLNDIDFEWMPHNYYWDRMFSELSDFKIENGHCRVPAIYRKSKELGIWVSNLRSFYKRRKLSQDRISLLEAFPGWLWSVREK
jgi:hypothetical protein